MDVRWEQLCNRVTERLLKFSWTTASSLVPSFHVAPLQSGIDSLVVHDYIHTISLYTLTKADRAKPSSRPQGLSGLKEVDLQGLSVDER